MSQVKRDSHTSGAGKSTPAGEESPPSDRDADPARPGALPSAAAAAAAVAVGAGAGAAAGAAIGDRMESAHKAGFKNPWQRALQEQAAGAAAGGHHEGGAGARHQERAQEEANAQRLADILSNERSKRV